MESCSMDTIKVGCNQVKMIAHRGLSHIERENTNAAFIAAGNRSYFGIETDVHKTSDGQFILIHDSLTGRVTNQTIDVDVDATEYDTLKQIVLSDLDGSLDRQDLRIPLLTDYIRICKKYEKICVLEIKGVFPRFDLEQLVEIIGQEEYLESVIFISFGIENCIVLRELLPDSQIQWLTSKELTEENKQNLYRYHLDLDIKYELLTKDIVDELHAKNVQINCWTCDNRQDAEALIEMGVDYITTNILE